MLSSLGEVKGAVAINDTISVSRVVATGASRWLRDCHEAREISVIHQHGIWAPLPVASGRFARRADLPLVLSPHGMLETWAMAHHAMRKRLAWWLYQRENLKAATVLHATSRAEAERFRELGFSQPIAVISLGINPIADSPLDLQAVTAPKPRRQVLFLSRIHPKKGIDLLLDAWAGIHAPDWELVIAGNDEGGYQAALEEQAANLQLRDRVRFLGPVFGAEKDTAFRRADLFVLPSHSENFGIVVPEALQYGLPVVTTTGTPWEILERENCGWRVAPTQQAIGAALAEAIGLSEDQRRDMGEKGRNVVDRDHRWRRLAEGYLALYRWLAAGGDSLEDIDSVHCTLLRD